MEEGTRKVVTCCSRKLNSGVKEGMVLNTKSMITFLFNASYCTFFCIFCSF